jgi:hypothetical protein
VLDEELDSHPLPMPPSVHTLHAGATRLSVSLRPLGRAPKYTHH